MLDKGLVQVYTGDGKGKTTAALGLALRAAGHGHGVLIYQFLKPASLKLGERLAVERGDLPITVRALDAEWDLAKSLDDPAHVAAAKTAIMGALGELCDLARRCAYDVIVLDEIVYCLSKGLAAFEDIERLVACKHRQCELVLTGRGADERLAKLADLVTEMTARKHPYDGRIGARKGIDF
jgi:cob(I)alamin adenosyltransferase